jgi:uncharacterized protein DUF5069
MIDAAAPRRWSDDVDGIRWLPRLIDKARLWNRGVLGTYLFGHSPVDRAMLARLEIATDEFAAIVAAAPDDEAVLAALRARGFDEARVRRWSDHLPKPFQLFLRMIDLDEGHIEPSTFDRAWMGAFRVAEGGLMSLVRVVSPKP